MATRNKIHDISIHCHDVLVAKLIKVLVRANQNGLFRWGTYRFILKDSLSLDQRQNLVPHDLIMIILRGVKFTDIEVISSHWQDLANSRIRR